MGITTFNTLRRQVMQLYQAREYTQLLELVEKEQGHFPVYEYRIAYWRLIMNALSGKQAEALEIFRAAVEQGLWFPPHVLKYDPDLTSLRALPEFQTLTEICKQRLVEFQEKEARPLLLTQQPEPLSEMSPVLIALHSNAGDAATTLEEWGELTTYNWLLAVPQSSQAAGPTEYVWEDRELGASEIRAHLATLTSRYHPDLQRVVLGGFSMGGGQAIWMAMQQALETPGFVVLGPYLRPAELEAMPALLAARKPARLRGFILAGAEDYECLAISRQVAAIMSAHELPCKLVVFPGLEHDYPENFVEHVVKGLEFIFA